MKKHAKDAIIESFKELVSRKSLDRVTVKEICDHCGVNRQSFYNHFSDIMAVFKTIFYEELSHEIAQNRTFETWGGRISGNHELYQAKFENDPPYL